MDVRANLREGDGRCCCILFLILLSLSFLLRLKNESPLPKEETAESKESPLLGLSGEDGGDTRSETLLTKLKRPGGCKRGA